MVFVYSSTCIVTYLPIGQLYLAHNMKDISSVQELRAAIKVLLIHFSLPTLFFPAHLCLYSERYHRNLHRDSHQHINRNQRRSSGCSLLAIQTSIC